MSPGSPEEESEMILRQHTGAGDQTPGQGSELLGRCSSPTSIIFMYKRLKQEAFHMLKPSLAYVVNFRPLGATEAAGPARLAYIVGNNFKKKNYLLKKETGTGVKRKFIQLHTGRTENSDLLKTLQENISRSLAKKSPCFTV